MITFQAILVILSTSPVFITSLTHCELAIIRCCDTEGHSRDLPIRCFEKNLCAGLYWYGRLACSPQLVAQAISSLGSTMTPAKTKPKQEIQRKVGSKSDSPQTNSIVDSSQPTPCELAVLRCCDARQTTLLPFRCLEVNKCPGLYWQGRRTCSRSLVTSAIESISRKIKNRKKKEEKIITRRGQI